MADYEYKVATKDKSRAFGAWLNSVAIDGWRYKEHIPKEGFVPGEGSVAEGFYIFEREKTIVKSPAQAKNKSKVKPTD